MTDDTFVVEGTKTKYVLRKPRIADWKSYYKKRKQLKEEYNDPQGENFMLTLHMIENCLVEPKDINIDDIPIVDFTLLSEALLTHSIPSPLQKKASPLT